MKIKTLILLSSISIFILSCSKDGTTGPQGPTGNANIMAVNFQVTNTQWTGLGTQAVIYTFLTTAITQEVINSGTLQLFVSPNDTLWHEWNGTNQFNGIRYTYEYSVGTLSVDVLSGSATITSTNLDPVSYFKLVVIPPAMKAYHPSVNYKNYTEVKQAFNLPD